MAKNGQNGHFGSKRGQNGSKWVQNRSFSKGLFGGPNRPSTHGQRVQKGKMGILGPKGVQMGSEGSKTPLNSGYYMRGNMSGQTGIFVQMGHPPSLKQVKNGPFWPEGSKRGQDGHPGRGVRFGPSDESLPT